MPKPLIGITVDCKHDPDDVRSRGRLSLNWNYAQCVAEAGGVPLLIPPMADLEVVSALLDGWLIPGGNDIDAKHWGEENHPTVEAIDPARFEAERALYNLVGEDLPVFGICYGCQFVNVQRGGSLVQHIPEVVGHARHGSGEAEPIRVEPDSFLHRLTGAEVIQGRSYHHQAVGRLGGDLRITARAEDGTIEALEATDRPWMVGVQWHPERTLEDEPTQRLFRAFVAAAAEFRAKRPQ